MSTRIGEGKTISDVCPSLMSSCENVTNEHPVKRTPFFRETASKPVMAAIKLVLKTCPEEQRNLQAVVKALTDMESEI